MKKICSLVSIIMLVTLASIQLVQAAHHHDETHHFSKHPQSSSHQDLQLISSTCFICTFHSNRHADAAILPSVFQLAFFMATPLVINAEAGCEAESLCPPTSYNKGPPVSMMLSF